MSIIDIIDNYGEKSDCRVAHEYRDYKLTYRQLREKSNALANYIIKNYGKDKTPIVVYGHKQNEMLVCFLASVKAGHPYIPVDSSMPLERVKDIVEASEAKIIFNVGNHEIEFVNFNIIGCSEIKEIIEEFKEVELDKSYVVKENETYYIIFTSGSTGKPKGVQITLSCLESFVKWGLKVSKLKLDSKEIFLNQAPFSFDLSVMDLYLSLVSGSTLYSIDKDMIANIKLLFEKLRESNISMWVSTPSFADLCLGDSSYNKDLLPSLKTMLFCGEILTNNCANKLHDRFEGLSVINMYGPTEATVAVTAVEVTKNICEEIAPLPVGIVKEDCKILIVDDCGNCVENGEKGEIVIAGESVSTGYYKDVERTNKSFYKLQIEGKELKAYRTGDEGLLKGDMLYYSGRIDFQVKLNGYRIELEDIENNLRNVSLIKTSVVVPVLNEGKVYYLAAVVVLNKKIEEKEFKIALMIKNELKKYIPEYMIPRKIVIKDSLPMTNNGKVDRKTLMEEIK